MYKGKIRVEYNLLNYLCYVTFFPTITSGPIERADDLLNQIRQNRIFIYENELKAHFDTTIKPFWSDIYLRGVSLKR